MIPHIQIPDDALVRNSDSWRIAYVVAEIGEMGGKVVVSNRTGIDLWDERYLEPIEPCDLDKALMDLRRTSREMYDAFLATMLGLDGVKR